MPTLHALLPSQVPTPTPTPSDLFTRDPGSCVDRADPGILCRLTYDWTSRRGIADFVNDFVAKPFTIICIFVGAFVLRWLVHRAINRLAIRASAGTVPGVLAHRRGGQLLEEASPLIGERRQQRAATMGSVLKSVATAVILSVAVLMSLSELGLNIAPLIASAGILGLALGFGAQTLVKDFISGIFMVLEDQYGVGDVVDLGEASGSVEAVGLRVTRLRSVEGTVWYVRNGEINRVGNKSQGWARAVIDVAVAYGEDIGHVRDLLAETAHALTEDERFGPLVLEEPEVWGVEELSVDAVVVRVVVKTQPLKQWEVARELRQRIKAAFDEHHIEMPFAQRTIWLRTEGPGADAAPAPSP